MDLGYKFEFLTLACSHQAVIIGTDLTSQGLRTLAGDVEDPGSPGAPTMCPKTALRPVSGGTSQELLETPLETATQHQGIPTGTLGKADVTSAGSSHFEAGRLQLCRWALYKQRCRHHFCPSSHVRYCHLVTFRNLLVLKALIWNNGLCQHFCAEFLFSMIYNEAYF